MIRVICLIGGLAGAVGLSQYPEFSQQYIQRLAGQVDALTIEAKRFDDTALAEGMGREEALQALTGSDFLDRRQVDMRAMFARHARLSDNLLALRAATPLERLILPHRMVDGPTMQEVWGDFTPAVPVSVAGVAAAGTGFVGGWALFAVLIAGMVAPFRRFGRTRADVQRREPRVKQDPPVMRPRLVTEQSHTPRLGGAQR
ncbi:DUF2937 family protein [Cognatiyoonia sp. IB215182]|uniref:DUF2937 family protein n=1 Tax=Cognatiyoonia sp. IB215182 TaxID=3097353 RepID=UPI002A0FEBD0|nr:DUF2937 family protein [Cognatiyoonia sp. IB215182]MDX8353709.1 DUF2937 family protein [Cognatiyoonia sp. IB215182]